MNYPGFQQAANNATASQQATPQQTSDEYKPVEKLKQKGNDLFKQNKYKEASSTYVEVCSIY